MMAAQKQREKEEKENKREERKKQVGNKGKKRKLVQDCIRPMVLAMLHSHRLRAKTKTAFIAKLNMVL
jgi:predicted metal-dependent hydrolase